MNDRSTHVSRPIPAEPMEVFEGYSYSQTNPRATYSPWFDDKEFMQVYGVIQSSTLIDMYRLYELWTLAESSNRVGGDIVEVGVWRGGSGCLLAYKDQALNQGTSSVFLCDTFKGVVKAGAEDSHYIGGEHDDTDSDSVNALARQLGVGNTKILKGIFPDDTGEQLAGRRIRMVHIDVDVYDSAKDIVHFLWPLIPVGGVVVFDDFGGYKTNGVTKLVNKLRKELPCLFFHNLNGHGILVKM